MNLTRLSNAVPQSRLLFRRPQSIYYLSLQDHGQPLSTSSTRWDYILPRESLSNYGYNHKTAITSRSQIASAARRIVVKVGSAVLTREDNCGLALGRVASLVEQVASLQNSGREIIMVSSGAVAFGKQKLAQELVMSMSMRQTLHSKDYQVHGNKVLLEPRAAAAVGQSGLMSLYEAMFAQYGLKVAQVLVTKENFTDEYTKKHLFQTMSELLALNIVPIVNTNDAVAAPAQIYDALEGDITINDNDTLAAFLSAEVQADLMILMSDVDGVFTDPPGLEGSGSRVLHTYCPSDIQGGVRFGAKSSVGSGGMQSKVSAAIWALQHGIAAVICNGSREGALNTIIAGKRVGTFFTTHAHSTTSPEHIADLAKKGGRQLANLTGAQRSEMINSIGELLISRKEDILIANRRDLENAKDTLSSAECDRLKITDVKINSLASGLQQMARESVGIVGRKEKRILLASGLELHQITVPIGLLMVIFEARPDCLPQIASLSIASANGLVLKGGSEAFNTNNALMSIVSEALLPHGVQNAIQMVATREDVNEIIGLGMVDLIIPRGSSSLVKSVTAQAQGVPVLGHSEGNCHIYVDIDADLEKVLHIVKDAKCNYPAACNAVETILIHKELLNKGNFFKKLCDFLKSNNVEIYSGPNLSKELTFGPPLAKSLKTEYGRLACNLEIVSDFSEAVRHINAFGSSHTEAIITENEQVANEFLKRVDSACVFHNASTRFADGYRFGLGAEVGISTGRIHARGPVGVEGLLTTKWILHGQGDAASDFGPGAKVYKHQRLPLDESIPTPSEITQSPVDSETFLEEAEKSQSAI
ncbi:unnamed protein product [Allacma fusca]|uniref:Delta-1-pyrroline-5-carboxylate synthase n=1 Tax=Allacma fusca TaxID=39272 RepID=A0A8J2K8C3_9HEXA|nr:unnamed protein product [Allacma fusca]